MDIEVAIQQLCGAPVDKQAALCAEFATDQDWHVKTIVPPGGADETVRLVREGYVELVVMPFVDREALAIEARVNDAGGKVAYCRQPERRSLDPDTSGVIAFLHDRGRPIGDIASFLRVAPELVRRALRRRGFG